MAAVEWVGIINFETRLKICLDVSALNLTAIIREEIPELRREKFFLLAGKMQEGELQLAMSTYRFGWSFGAGRD